MTLISSCTNKRVVLVLISRIDIPVDRAADGQSQQKTGELIAGSGVGALRIRPASNSCRRCKLPSARPGCRVFRLYRRASAPNFNACRPRIQLTLGCTLQVSLV